MLKPEVINKISEMANNGSGATDISRELKISYITAQKYMPPEMKVRTYRKRSRHNDKRTRLLFVSDAELASLRTLGFNGPAVTIEEVMHELETLFLTRRWLNTTTP